MTRYNLASDAAFNYVSSGASISPLEGKPIYSILSYPFAGLDGQGNPQSIVGGQNSTDYVTITGSQLKVGDLVYSGSAIPTTYGSITNSFFYKRFEFNFNISYKLGYYFRRQSVSYSQFFQNGLMHSDYLQRWKSPGDEKLTSIPSLQFPNDNRRDAFYSNSAILVSKGDHVRLNFVNLNYNLSKSSVKTLPFKSLQLTLNAANLGVIWRVNRYNIDPEYPDMQPGKQLSIGIRASF